jgi:hypothetical protein
MLSQKNTTGLSGYLFLKIKCKNRAILCNYYTKKEVLG